DVVRTAQLALMDAMLFRLGDAVPRVEDQQIVDTPILQGERRHLDNIDKLPRLDERMLIRLNVDCSKAFGGRIGHSYSYTLCFRTVAVNPSQDVAVAIPRCSRSHP